MTWQILVKWIFIGLALIIGTTAALIIGLWIFVSNSSGTKPDLARGLDYNTSPTIMSTHFNQLVQEKFPTPIEEALFIRELEEQGFEIDHDVNKAIFSGGYFRCLNEFDVSWWSSDGETVSVIVGAYSVDCFW